MTTGHKPKLDSCVVTSAVQRWEEFRGKIMLVRSPSQKMRALVLDVVLFDFGSYATFKTSASAG